MEICKVNTLWYIVIYSCFAKDNVTFHDDQ